MPLDPILDPRVRLLAVLRSIYDEQTPERVQHHFEDLITTFGGAVISNALFELLSIAVDMTADAKLMGRQAVVEEIAVHLSRNDSH